MANSDKQEGNWFFLSFRDPVKNLNLGCCNVQAKGGLEAIAKTRQLGINPGGEVASFKIEAPELEPNRLYSRREMLNLGYEIGLG